MRLGFEAGFKALVYILTDISLFLTSIAIRGLFSTKSGSDAGDRPV